MDSSRSESESMQFLGRRTLREIIGESASDSSTGEAGGSLVGGSSVPSDSPSEFCGAGERGVAST